LLLDWDHPVQLGSQMLPAKSLAARAAAGVGEASLDGLEGLGPGAYIGPFGSDQVLHDRSAIGGKHLGDLVKPEPGPLAQNYHCQAVDGAGLVLTAQPSAPHASDEPMTLVVVQRRGWQPGLGTDRADVELVTHQPQP
jgi:hypothetical protein